MSTSSSVPETTATVPGSGSEAQITTSSGASNTAQPNGVGPSTTTASTQPERKTLVLMEMGAANSETTVRELFSGLKQGTVSGVEVASNTYFVTFSSGDAATEAFQVAFSKSLSVKFKTTSSVTAPASTGAVNVPYYGYPVASQEFTQYWEPSQGAYVAPGAGADVNGQYYRGGPRGTGATNAHTRVGAPGFAASGGAPGATANRVGGHPKSKGPRGPASTHYASSTPAAASNDATGATGTGASGASTHGAPHSPTQRSGQSGRNAAAPVRHSSGGSPTNANNHTNAHTRSGTGAPRRNGASGNASSNGQGRRSERSHAPGTRPSGAPSHKGEPKDKPNLSLASFPPLVHPSGNTASGSANASSAASHGYGAQPFTQYSRETILATIASHDANQIQRPDFDNADAPILLTTPQTDLEVNKPLPVGAKFEPLATDKRTRSLSKKSDASAAPAAPAQPTAAQIVAAAAAKSQQTSTVKIVTAKAASSSAPAKTQGKKDEVATAAHKGAQTKKPTSTQPAPAASAPAAKPTPAAPSVLSWADRARAPPAPVEHKKKTEPVAPVKPVSEPTSVAPTASTTETTPSTTHTEPSDATNAVEAQ